MSFPDRLCSIIRMAGFHAVTTHSPQTAISKVRVLKPALVVFSQRVGRPGVSETARRIKNHTGEPDTPLMILTEDDGRPYLNDTSYPVEACFPASADTKTLVRNLHLLARKTRRRREDRPFAALEGNIEGSTISEVLQYLSTAGKTGSLSVRCGRRGGRIYLDRGEVVHAYFGPLIGVEACHAIVCLLQDGYFEFESDVRPPRTSMRENGVELVLEWAREMDEMARRRRVQPVND